MTDQGIDRATAVHGSPATLTLRLVTFSPRPQRFAQDTRLTERAGQLTFPLPSGTTRVVLSVGTLADSGRFVSIAHTEPTIIPTLR